MLWKARVSVEKKYSLRMWPAYSLKFPSVESMSIFYIFSSSKNRIFSSTTLMLKLFCCSMMFASSRVAIMINYSILVSKVSFVSVGSVTPSVIRSYRIFYF